jgi:DNA-directed RNA polymerase subunit omega
MSEDSALAEPVAPERDYERRPSYGAKRMHEELKEEDIVNLVGGRFKLSTLIQKRLVQLNQGSRPLVELVSASKMEIVLREIRDGKIELDTSNEVRPVVEGHEGYLDFSTLE